MNLKRIIGAAVLAGAIGGYYLLRDTPNNLIGEIRGGHYPTKDYGIHATVTDKNGSEFVFKEFHLDQSCIRYHSAFNRMAVTLRGEDRLEHVFWMNQIDRIEYEEKRKGKGPRRATVHFNDGKKFRGKWVTNKAPYDFYPAHERSPYAKHNRVEGFGNLDGKLWTIYFEHSRSVDIDSSGANAALEEEFRELRREKYPKTIELADGSAYSTDLGYIVDCVGVWSRSCWQPQMKERFGLNPAEGKTKYLSLENVAEILLTGEFDEKKPQCRMAVVKYNNGGEESGSIQLASESHNGYDDSEECYREWDGFLLHNERGALIVPLSRVRKIIPRNTQLAARAGGGEK